MTESIKMIEIFSGIGAQAKALGALPIPHEVVATMDVDKEAIVSYAAMRYDLEKEIENYKFPSKETMVSELQSKNVGFDFVKQKHSITMKTNIDKVKLYYISDKLSKNLGDVSLQKELPYVDIIFHSSPCQSFSCAGKGEGGDEGSGTTSSLMWESLRLIGTSMPRFIVWENVAAVLSGKHGHNFIKYLERLSEMGYESAFELLNSKNYGVPQNRLRIFCVSRKIENENNRNITIKECKSSNKQVINTMKEIRENHPNIKIWEDFTFPEPIPLTTRLKDILEISVDEKYYLPDERIEKILNSSFMQEKKRIQIIDVCDTLLAQDWKDPKCVPIEEEPEVRQIMNIMPGTNRDNPNQGRVYDKEGISPALTTMEGGNRQPFIIDEIKVVGNYMPSNNDASRVVDINGIAPTVKENHGTVTAIAEPFVVASRGRNPKNPSDRTTGAPTEQRLEPNFSGTTNCLMSVAKDNYVCEPKIIQNPHGFNKGSVQEECPSITSSYFQENNYVAEPIIYDDYNSRISADQEAINTLTCNCGASAERNGVKIIEPVIVEDFYQSREPRVYSEVAPTLRSEQTGLKVADEIEYPCSTRGKQVASAIRASIYKQGARNLEENVVNGLGYEGVIEKEEPKIRWRIRKLTPLECWRLMNFTDKDCIRAAQYISPSAQYKQAGNSIVVACLIPIFSSLFIEDGYKAEVWTKYQLHYWD